jgi:hypothetical protein
MDPGRVVNPMNAKAQIQSAALWGASQILSERLTFANGAFEQSNFHDYTPIRLADAPQIDVELIESGHHPSGIGEPAATVVAPAVANAIYNAVGARVRHMPITAEAVLTAMFRAGCEKNIDTADAAENSHLHRFHPRASVSNWTREDRSNLAKFSRLRKFIPVARSQPRAE